MKNTAAGVPFILICVLLDILGIGLIIPVLPQLVGDLAGSQSAQAWWLGAMLIAYGLMQFCFAPTLGALSDRYGRRPVLLLGIFGLGIMFLVPALSQSLPVILFSRILGGMFAGNIAVAQAYISDVTDKAHRAAAFGKLGPVSASVSFSVRPSAEYSAKTTSVCRFLSRASSLCSIFSTDFLFFRNL